MRLSIPRRGCKLPNFPIFGRKMSHQFRDVHDAVTASLRYTYQHTRVTRSGRRSDPRRSPLELFALTWEKWGGVLSLVKPIY